MSRGDHTVQISASIVHTGLNKTELKIVSSVSSTPVGHFPEHMPRVSEANQGRYEKVRTSREGGRNECNFHSSRDSIHILRHLKKHHFSTLSCKRTGGGTAGIKNINEEIDR